MAAHLGQKRAQERIEREKTIAIAAETKKGIVTNLKNWMSGADKGSGGRRAAVAAVEAAVDEALARFRVGTLEAMEPIFRGYFAATTPLWSPISMPTTATTRSPAAR